MPCWCLQKLNNGMTQTFCPRLIDYVCIVGARFPNSNSIAQTPELLRRYPLTNHNDFPLPPDVVFFCQPEGCISVGQKRVPLRESSSFVFTLTDKESGIMRYGICVNFFRSFDRKYVNEAKSKVFASVTGGDSNSKSKIFSRSSLHNDSNNHESTDSENFDIYDKHCGNGCGNRRFKKARQRNNTLTSLCIISHHPFFSTFRECLFTLRQLVDACNERSCSRRVGGTKGVYRDTVWGLLSGCIISTDISSVVLHDVREIEMWILRLLSAPVPVPGKTRVEVELLPSNIKSPVVFALPDSTRFSLCDFPLHLPLELLGVDTCLKVLTCIILEHKIVLQSRDYNALSMSLLAFVKMLYPLEYMFPVIPLLPTCMNNAEQITVPLNADELPRIVEPECSVLKSHLKQALEIKFPPKSTIQSLRAALERAFMMEALSSMSMPEPICNLDTVDLSTVQPPPITNKQIPPLVTAGSFIYGNDVDSIDIATRVAMVRFFNSPNILANHSEHTRILRLFPRPVVAFQLNSFLKSRPVLSPFLSKLSRTQAVEYFCEWSLSPNNMTYQRIHTGVYDPSSIGDKGKWYADHLMPILFPVCQRNSSLAAALIFPEDVEDSDSNLTETYSIPSSTLDHASVYQPPRALQIPEGAKPSPDPQVYSSDNDGDSVTSDSDGEANDGSSIKEFKNPMYDSLSDKRKLQPHQKPPASDNFNGKDLKSKQSFERTDSGKSRFNLLEKNSRQSAKRQLSNEINKRIQSANTLRDPQQLLEHILGNDVENQTFLQDLVENSLEGNSPGFFSQKKLRKLMENESLRAYVVTKLNTTIDKPVIKDYVDDVEISNKKFNSIGHMLKTCIAGLEDGIKSHNFCGMASVFMLLEIAYTRYQLRNVNSAARLTKEAGLKKMEGFAEKNEGQQLAKQKTLDGATMHFTTTKSHYEHEAYRPRITVEGVSNQAFSYKHGQNQDLLTEVDAKRRQMEQMRKDSSLSSDTTSPLLSNSSDVHACDSDVSVSSGNETPLSYVQRRISHHSIRSNFSDSDVDISQIGKKHNIPQAASSVVTSEINSVKSVFSKGFRYNCGSLIKIPNVPSPEDNTRKYLFELLIEKDRSPLWDNLQFWEDCYLDAIAAERDAMGMDQSPCDMIERYKHLHDGEKKRLDEEEDRLLAAVLFNMIAFMLSMGVNKRDIRKKVRRLLGRSHIGLSSSHEINECLDIIQYLNGNDVDLKPLLSRQIHKQTFVVHSGTDTTGDVLFLEVCEDCIVIRNGSGAVFEKLYYEKLINMSYSPKAKVLCLWRLRHMDSTLLSKFYTKKCKELYYRIKESMERAASKRPLDDKVPELGGEFPIQDVKTEQYGKLHITLDGIGFKFDTFKLLADARWLYVSIALRYPTKYVTRCFVCSHMSQPPPRTPPYSSHPRGSNQEARAASSFSVVDC